MKTENIFITLTVVAWIMFVGFCIEAGTLAFNVVWSWFINHGLNIKTMGIELRELLSFSAWHHTVFGSLLTALAIFKALLMYEGIKLTGKLSLKEPFSEWVTQRIERMAHYAWQAALVSVCVDIYAGWLKKQTITLGIRFDNDWSEFLLLAGILYVIASIFKRGIQLQEENELTV